MPKLKFSIITCAYNHASFLSMCLSSVRSQTYSNWEHIILNDCSSDTSTHALKRLSRDPRVTVIKSPKRLYCGSAYDLVSKSVTGDLVGVLDADDVLEPHAMKSMVSLYKSNTDVDFIYSQHWECKGAGRAKLRPIKSGVSSLPPVGLSLMDTWEQRMGHGFSHWRTCRASMLQHGLFPKDYKFGIDKYMGMVLESYGQGAFYNVPLYRYRMHPQQMTGFMRSTRVQVKNELISAVRSIRKTKNLTPPPIREITL